MKCPLKYVLHATTNMHRHYLFFHHIDPSAITPEEINLCIDSQWSIYWNISKYGALGTLCLLTLWELMQLTTKIVNGQFWEFFGWQNMIEGLMITLTFTFYLVEQLEYDPSKLFYSNFIIKFSSYLNSISFQQLQSTI